MGQQQLLLLVLGIVIVGLSVTSGIESFQENRRKSTADRVYALAAQTMADVTAWKAKPGALAGGQTRSFLNGFTWQGLGYGETYDTVNQIRLDPEGIWLYYPPFNLGANGAPMRILHPEYGVGVELRFYGDTTDCIQLIPMTAPPGRGTTYGRGWTSLESTWADASTIPASCPSSW
ncbi:MAG: hypothetical protein AAFN13_11405 [Bacteroidota bacterium]